MQAFTRRLAFATLMAGVILWGNAAWAQAADPLIGTWKLNVEKSTYSPGPPPKSLTVKIEAVENGEKVTADGVRADGQPIRVEYTAKYDGKDYPIKGSAMGADTVSLKRIDASTTERTDKAKDGKVVYTLTRKVSSDGKMMTATGKGTNPQGQAVNNVAVVEKQ